MNNHLTSTAQVCAQSIPHVYTTKTVRRHLTKKPVRYHARPLYSGPAISVTITLTDVVIDPPLEVVGCNRLVGFNWKALTGWRRYLGDAGCNAIRLDGRVLDINGGRKCKIDYFRVCLLQDDTPRAEKVILAEYPQGDPAFVHHYLEVGRSNVTDALARAKHLSLSAAKSADRPYADVAAEIDAVLWVSEVTNKGPSFVVPLQDTKTSSSKIVHSVFAAADTKENDVHATQQLPSATLAPDTHRLLSFEEITPWLDREITYVAHPIFQGQDITIVVDSNGFHIGENLLGREDLDRVSKICSESADRLRAFLNRVIRTVGGDTLRLDGRVVSQQRGMPWCVDIHRTVVLDQGTPMMECPYDEEIFELDERPPMRLFTWLSPDNSHAMKGALQDLTFSFVQTMELEDRPVEISGTLWLPVNSDRHRPSFYVPFKPSPMSPVAVEAFLACMFSKRIDDLYHLEGLEITPWK